MSDNADDAESERTFVVFLDSFGHGDLEHTPWIRENCNLGELDANPVYVTPIVLGSIYTGENPAQHGMPAVSRYGTDARLRPNGLTIPEIAANTDTYESVLQLGLPFIVPPQVQPQGTYWHQSSAMGQTVYLPPNQQGMMQIPGPAGRLDVLDENFGLAFDMRVDVTQSVFGNARNLAAMHDADLTFISYRHLDSYCHYQYLGPEDNPEATGTYREMLLEEVDRQVSYLAEQGEVFIFGDHGTQELTDVFRVNRWLIELGYLEATIDTEWREKAEEYGIIEDDDAVPGETLTADSPGVTVHEGESVAISTDPFSGGITLLDGANEETARHLKQDLLDHPAVKDVIVPAEVWEGDLLDECPDLYIHREDGWFVSGNLAPEPGGAEVTRSGVHHPLGYVATTDDTFGMGMEVTPAELFDVIAEGFLGLDTDVSVPTGEGQEMELSEEQEAEMQAHLEEMGYI